MKSWADCYQQRLKNVVLKNLFVPIKSKSPKGNAKELGGHKFLTSQPRC